MGEMMWTRFNIVYVEGETLAGNHIVWCRASAKLDPPGEAFLYRKRHQHANIYSLAQTRNLCSNNDLCEAMDCQ